MEKIYSLKQIQQDFDEIFETKAKRDEEESLSCGFKRSYYHFLSFDEKTQEITYRVSEKNDPNAENVFFYDTKISLENLYKMKK
ncbi:hypothetical protein [Mycoplasma procyoni]|uniref:hypothetical protein n=1 Tax=Mycoplasma procyoni TaxID=568784 RepID=UPI00197B56EB|nr:hypothetical protein [Mycoplasma procyoni]MBN3534721.1 hypothetical protein [Mycoplasma procyoni]